MLSPRLSALLCLALPTLALSCSFQPAEAPAGENDQARAVQPAPEPVEVPMAERVKKEENKPDAARERPLAAAPMPAADALMGVKTAEQGNGLTVGSGGLGLRAGGVEGGGEVQSVPTMRAVRASTIVSRPKEMDAAELRVKLKRPEVQTEALASGEGYRDAGVNPLTLSSEDPLSTFATDVDTGSFTLARRLLLEEGRLPEKAGVRVEEFINYPNWAYPTPVVAKTDSPVAVTLEAAPHPWQPGHHLVRVGLRADDMKGERAPANLVFLVDVSGSMSGPDRLPRARAALHTLVDSLGPADSVALVTYAGSTGVVLEPTRGDQKARIHAGIDGLSSGGGTAMAAGIDLAYGLAKASMRTGAESRVIVLSDGDANIGNSTPEALLGQIKQYAGQGITLSTIGFGVGNYQDAMMEQFANKGDGNYYYIDSLDEAERVFTQNLAGTVQTVARDVKVQIAFDPEIVHAWRLVGYENRDVADRDFRNDKVDGGEMGSGQRVTVLYDVVLNTPPAGETTLATVSFRAKKPGVESAAKEWKTSLNVGSVRQSFDLASADFRAAVGMAGFAELLRHSQYTGELTFGQVASILQGARRTGRDDGQLEEMVKKATALWSSTAVYGMGRDG